MEEKINIAEILKDKPEKTILYDTMRDINVSLYVVEKRNGETNIFCDGMEKFKGCSFVYSDTGADSIFRKGMQLLKPSKEMQDWEKFSWKRGDVLISDCGFVCIFKEWASDDYTKFNGCYFDGMPNAETAKYSKLDNNTAYGYIREIENRCGGKLNLETLEIEKQNEFKDGDIVTQGVLKGINVYIIKNCIDKIDNKYNYYARYNTQDKEIDYDDWAHISPFAKFATNSEKQQLLDALALKSIASRRLINHPAKDINISNMEERMFLVIVKGEINESEMSLKRAISEAIGCEAKEYDESPLYGCDVSVKEVED